MLIDGSFALSAMKFPGVNHYSSANALNELTLPLSLQLPQASRDGREHAEEREVSVEDLEPALEEVSSFNRRRQLKTIGRDDRAERAVERDVDVSGVAHSSSRLCVGT